MMRARRLLGCAGGTFALVLLAGCTAAVPKPSPTPSSTDSGTIAALVVGDSLASGGRFDSLPWDPGSWTEYLDERILVTGGWRRDGATTRTMAEQVPSERADAVLIIGGTNDAHLGVPETEIVENIEKIVGTVDVEHVVVGAIPPTTHTPEAVAKINAAIESAALARGWSWVDPWAEDRDGVAWVTESSPDGVHASSAAYARAGAAMSAALFSRVD